MIGAEGGSRTRTTLRLTDFKPVSRVLTTFYYALPSSIYRRFSRQSKLRLAWYRHVTPSSSPHRSLRQNPSSSPHPNQYEGRSWRRSFLRSQVVTSIAREHIVMLLDYRKPNVASRCDSRNRRTSHQET